MSTSDNEGDTAKKAIPTMEALWEQVSNEVGRAIENIIPTFVDNIQSTILDIMNEKFEELKEILLQDRGKVKEKKLCTYDKFMACKPTLFNGEVDPIICRRWVTDMEGVFDRSHCDPADRVAYATGQFWGRAKDWWDVIIGEKGVDVITAMTWEEFKGPFLNHHCPPAVINRIKEEFMQLRQRGETIDKITGVFLDKMKFCGELVKTEESRIYYYHNMRGAEYREFITPSKFETLSEIINAAREREVELKKQIERANVGLTRWIKAPPKSQDPRRY
jgi:hypothetical protein